MSLAEMSEEFFEQEQFGPRDVLREAQRRRDAAKADADDARGALQRANNWLAKLQSDLGAARAEERAEAVERAKAFAADGGNQVINIGTAGRRCRDIEDAIGSVEASIEVLKQSVADAERAECEAECNVGLAVGGVMAAEAKPLFSRLRDCERSAAFLRSQLKAYNGQAKTAVPGRDGHITLAGLAAHLGAEPENSPNKIGGLNSDIGPWRQRLEDDAATWRNFREALRRDASALPIWK